MDAVKAANSGHTGTACALAPLAHVLFTHTLRYDPTAPDWADRDRLILSAGHASMLLYAALHLVGYDISLDDIRNFRQLGSITPGHPERGVTPGIEVTTGPLGQGLANAVGMALAERNLRARLGADLVDHHIFTIVGDGDLMEGISHEAASLAGHQQLGRLTAVYDDNHITIDGSTDLALSDDAPARFGAYGWHVENLGEASEDTAAIASALDRARLVTDRPSLLVLRSHIGYPLPNAVDTAAAHGAITDAEEIAAAKSAMGMDPGQTFVVDDEVAQAYRTAGCRGADEHAAWNQRLADSGHDQVWLAALWSGGTVPVPVADTTARPVADTTTKPVAADAHGDATGTTNSGTTSSGTTGGDAATNSGTTGTTSGDAATNSGTATSTTNHNWTSVLPTFEAGTQLATRTASNRTLNALLDVVPSLIAGGADLTGNTGTNIDAEPLTPANPAGRKLYFGVREHAMGALANGMAAHGGVLPVVGTFLVFSDYMRPAVRMAALSGTKVAFVWSHDSIGVGEDGPTHQPVEHVAALRAIPGLVVIRPADANETTQAWQVIVDSDGPTALILTRQNVPVLEGTNRPGQVARGAYILIDAPDPAVILTGTGSEVHCCVDAAAALAEEGIASRVVSMPSWELFETQPSQYRLEVLTEGVPVLGIEAGTSFGWDRYADETVTIDRFGASAPGGLLMETFGFTATSIAAAARRLLG